MNTMHQISPVSVIFIILYSSIAMMMVNNKLLLLANADPYTLPVLNMCYGGFHGCIAFNDGKFKCFGMTNSWGSNIGSPGIGDDPSELGNHMPYVDIGSSLSVTKVGCGYYHTCVMFSSGNMKCMGANDFGQCGTNLHLQNVGQANGFSGDSLPVINLGTSIAVLDIAPGYFDTCVKVTGNKIKCIGYNGSGQLGYGHTDAVGIPTASMGDNLPFVDLGTDYEVDALFGTSFASHHCATFSKPVNDVGKAKCWGLNDYFQLGYGSTNNIGDQPGEMGDSLPFLDFGTESKVIMFALGLSHTCALLHDSVLKCWGRGTWGQLGSGAQDNISATGAGIPNVVVDSSKTVIYVSANFYHTCVLYDDKLTVKCFGANDEGQLGQGDSYGRGYDISNILPNFPAIALGTGTIQISALATGNRLTCVIFADSRVKCFGKNDFGMLAIGSTSSIGKASGEMGANLEYSIYMSAPTAAPSKSPTNPTDLPSSAPSQSPTSVPSQSPSSSPTTRPTFSPVKKGGKPTTSPTSSPVVNTSSPTKSPSKVPSRAPTSNPTNVPTTKIPSKTPTNAPISSPSTSPTSSPTVKVIPYTPKTDCYMLTTKQSCEAEDDGQCGACLFFSDSVYYGFMVRIDFVMEGTTRFAQFESTSPLITTFKDAVKALMLSKLTGNERISIVKIGQIFQELGSRVGYVNYDINFIDSKTSKEAAKAYFMSQPSVAEYLDELNSLLNKKMRTTGKKYITGSIKISNLNIVDKGDGKGSCGCPGDDGLTSNATSVFTRNLLFTISSFIAVSMMIMMMS